MRVPFWDRFVRWLERSSERDRQIARGADKSLFAANARRRSRGRVLLLACMAAIFLAQIAGDGFTQRLLSYIGALCGLGAWLLLKWARVERYGLEKPEPEKPLSILDTRRRK